MSDDVTALRVQLHRAGYIPIPCVGKIPAIKEWQKHTETNEREIELWSRVFWDATNTGVLTANTPCFDIDILDPKAAEAV
jgi:putative DNA primase/helicase